MNKTEIKKWLDHYGIEKYTINDDLTVDVDGNVDLSDKKIKSIDVQFNKVNGYFDCYYNQLTSLLHCPSTVNGHFSCYYNQLTSLLHCPSTVNGYFDCSYNKLTSLLHCPSTVNGHFSCSNNQLTSLDELKYVKGDLYCNDNLKNTNGYKKYIMLKHLRK